LTFHQAYNLWERELRLPEAGAAGHHFLSLVVCSVALAITFATQFFLNLRSAIEVQEMPMNKNAYRKIVRTSVQQIIVATGTTAIGGCLAA
jgi:hypothetical protein